MKVMNSDIQLHSLNWLYNTSILILSSTLLVYWYSMYFVHWFIWDFSFENMDTIVNSCMRSPIQQVIQRSISLSCLRNSVLKKEDMCSWETYAIMASTMSDSVNPSIIFRSTSTMTASLKGSVSKESQRFPIFTGKGLPVTA